MRIYIRLFCFIISLIIGIISFIVLNNNSYNIDLLKSKSLTPIKSTSSSTIAPTELTIETQKSSPPLKESQNDGDESSVIGDWDTQNTDDSVCDNNQDRSLSFSASDREIIARVIMAESRSCSIDCLWFTGSALLNLADYYNNGDIQATANDSNIFDTADCYYDQEPTQECWDVTDRLISGDRDFQVMFFRTDYYHSFGTPYLNIDNVYFSTL